MIDWAAYIPVMQMGRVSEGLKANFLSFAVLGNMFWPPDSFSIEFDHDECSSSAGKEFNLSS